MMPHRIQIFSGACSLCRIQPILVEAGKRKNCTTEILDVGDPKNADSWKKYDVTAAPSIVIDGRKGVGLPDFSAGTSFT